MAKKKGKQTPSWIPFGDHVADPRGRPSVPRRVIPMPKPPPGVRNPLGAPDLRNPGTDPLWFVPRPHDTGSGMDWIPDIIWDGRFKPSLLNRFPDPWIATDPDAGPPPVPYSGLYQEEAGHPYGGTEGQTAPRGTPPEPGFPGEPIVDEPFFDPQNPDFHGPTPPTPTPSPVPGDVTPVSDPNWGPMAIPGPPGQPPTIIPFWPTPNNPLFGPLGEPGFWGPTVDPPEPPEPPEPGFGGDDDPTWVVEPTEPAPSPGFGPGEDVEEHDPFESLDPATKLSAARDWAKSAKPKKSTPRASKSRASKPKGASKRGSSKGTKTTMKRNRGGSKGGRK